MPSRTRLTPQAIDDALALQAQFWTRKQIAEKLGVHPSTISRALAKHNRRALALLEKRTAAIKAKQVAQLETIAREAFDAWRLSQSPKRLKRKVTSPDKQGVAQSTVTCENSTHHADPSLLNQVRGALADIREVLGIKGEKTRITTSPLVEALQELFRHYDAQPPPAIQPSNPRSRVPSPRRGRR